jgi:adenylate cyclase
MSKNFDYTRYARRFVVRFPVINYLGLQIIFWIIAYLLLAVLSYLVILTVNGGYQQSSIRGNIFLAIFFGFFYGLASGYVGHLFERRFFQNKSLGVIMLGKAVISLFVFVILISIVRSALAPYLNRKFFHSTEQGDQQSWDAFFYLVLIYTIAAGMVISFINQVNKKYGPGVLLPILLGRYRKPKEEERIFLFMDLKSSTSIAESLGHLKYSAFIRDSFMDINKVLADYYAQIYQYVGDEIVITWTIKEGTDKLSCIQFFFSCEARFKQRADHYLKQYGQIPEFKAGLHMGKVTAVEVGNIKRDIAYHGDTLNTTARIQSVCNQFNKRFLVSMYAVETMNIRNKYKSESIGMIELKGKSKAVEIASVDLS